MGDVTRILDRAQQGDPKTAEEQLPLCVVAFTAFPPERDGAENQSTLVVVLEINGNEHEDEEEGQARGANRSHDGWDGHWGTNSRSFNAL